MGTLSRCTKQHLNNNNKLKLLVTHGSHKDQDLHLDLHFSLLSSEKEDDRVTFRDPGFGCPFASCHELMLIRPDYQNDEELALWNPSTPNEVITALPLPTRPSDVHFEYAEFYGLGLDPKADDRDYKVIRNFRLEFEYGDIRRYHPISLYHTELYSFKTNSWKKIASPHERFAVLSDPIYINGFNYWSGSTGIRCDFAILSFDFANECFPSPLIPGPCGATYEFGRFLVAEYEGSLAVVVCLAQDDRLELWVWNGNQSSWSKRREWAFQAKSARLFLPLTLYNNDQFYFQDSSGELVLFDCAKQQLKKLGLCIDKGYGMRMFPCHTKKANTFVSSD